MGRFKAVFNTVTGVSSRHNRALEELSEWTSSIQKFLVDYRLYGSLSTDFLLEKAGDAKFDLTSLVYKARSLPSVVKNIRDSQITVLFEELARDIEETRRTLMNSTLKKLKVDDVTAGLRLSFEKLRSALDSVETM